LFLTYTEHKNLCPPKTYFPLLNLKKTGYRPVAASQMRERLPRNSVMMWLYRGETMFVVMMHRGTSPLGSKHSTEDSTVSLRRPPVM